MKYRVVLFFLFLTLLMSNPSTAHVMETESNCDAPTEQISITADHDNDGSLKYDTNELRVTKNTCVEITFYNKSPAVEHDFTIDETTEFSGIHMHIANNKGGDNGTDHQVLNFLMPDVDVTLEFYCSVTGHADGGMYGDFIIGEGSAAPGFNFALAIISMLAFVAIPQIRKRN